MFPSQASQLENETHVFQNLFGSDLFKVNVKWKKKTILYKMQRG